MKYYSRLLQMNSDILLGQTLQTSIDLHNEGFKTWYSGVKLILSEVNLGDYNLDQVKNNLKNRYKNIWFINFHKEAMQNQGKLRTLYLFKSCLETVTDARRRKCLTQLRISSHTLEVESGRYIKKPISERICKCCHLNQVEDEKHFLCICPLYDSERYFFFKYIKDLVPSFNTLDIYIYIPLASYRLSVTGMLYCSAFCDFILDEFSKSYFATLVEQDDINSFELV